MVKRLLFIILLLPALAGVQLAAEEYLLQDVNNSVIGEIGKTRTESKDTLLDIARVNGLGYHEIKRVNPDLDTWLPGDNMEVILPSKYVLPMARRDGIILNIPEMRLYFFPKGNSKESFKVHTYPLGIGREGWQTPYINTRIIQKTKNPAWHPPESIRKEHEEKGDPLPKRVGPGPDNPLGDYAMRLGLPEYLIHGTNKPYGIGMRVSHGCIRLYPEDIEELFQHVKLHTPVYIVNQPYKVGRFNDKIYLEAHPFLEEDTEQYQDNLTSVVKMIVDMTKDEQYQIEWDLAKQVIKEMNGIPIVIGRITTGLLQAKLDMEEKADKLSSGGVDLQLEMGISETP